MCLKRLTVVSVLLIQLGCVPNATTYYRPSMDGGEVLAKHCVPAESIVEFGDLPLQASVIEGHRVWVVALGLPSRRPLQLTWQTFYFATSEFYVRDPANGITTDRLPISVLRDDRSNSVVEMAKCNFPATDA